MVMPVVSDVSKSVGLLERSEGCEIRRGEGEGELQEYLEGLDSTSFHMSLKTLSISAFPAASLPSGL